jgi:Helix-turn-helix domain
MLLVDEQPWYSPARAGVKADLKPATIRFNIRMGNLKATKIGRVWRVAPEDLAAFLAGGSA